MPKEGRGDPHGQSDSGGDHRRRRQQAERLPAYSFIGDPDFIEPARLTDAHRFNEFAS
jgi:hypothetical protein